MYVPFQYLVESQSIGLGKPSINTLGHNFQGLGREFILDRVQLSVLIFFFTEDGNLLN